MTGTRGTASSSKNETQAPKTENKTKSDNAILAELIEEAVRNATKSITTAVTRGMTAMSEKIAALQKEVADLKDIVADLRTERTTEKHYSNNYETTTSQQETIPKKPDVDIKNNKPAPTKTPSGAKQNDKKTDYRAKNNQNMDKRNSTSNNTIIGEAINDHSGGFSAAERRLWLYIGRCKPNTEPELVQEFLTKKFKTHKFEITKLESKGNNKAFRVGASIELEHELYDSATWPQGVVIKRYRFFRSGKQPRDF